MLPGSFWILMYLATALVMLFQLRAMMQSSSADYYHPVTQAVTKITNPLVNIGLWRNIRIGSFSAAGMVVGFIIGLIAWIIAVFLIIRAPFYMAILGSIVLFIKCFGYLIIALLLIQALCSWLPATRDFSYLMGQITSPITAPVQRIIPPIGMIDISLMVILLALYALNALMYKVLGSISLEMLFLWNIL